VTRDPVRSRARAEAGHDRDATHVLANRLVSLRLTSRGTIESLQDQRSGREFIVDPTWSTLFRISLPLRERVGRHFVDPHGHGLLAEEQSSADVTSAEYARGASLRVAHRGLVSEAGRFEVDVDVEIRLPADDDAFTFVLRVRNGTSHRIPNLMFPLLGGCGARTDGDEDVLVFPSRIVPMRELLPHDQLANWEEHPYVALADPLTWGAYGLGMPWLNVGGTESGLYFASHDASGVHHTLVIQDLTRGRAHRGRQGGSIRPYVLGWDLLCDIGPGETWTSPEIIVSPHLGDWHAASDRYRDHLRGWYRPARRPRFSDTVASFNTVLTERRFDQIVDLARDIRQYGVRHLITLNFGDYYPNAAEPDDFDSPTPRLGQLSDQFGGPAALRAATDEARQLGVAVGCIFSQRLWNTATLTDELRAEAEHSVIRRETGAPAVEGWRHQHYSAAQWDAHFAAELYVMCPAVSSWQERALANIEAVFDRGGYQTFFYDQAIEDQPCWNPDHAHATPSDSLRASPPFLARLRDRLEAVDADSRLIAEGMEIRSSQQADLLWCWTDRLKPGRRQSHPEVWRYTLPGAPIALTIDDDLPTANRWFAQGVHLAIVPRSLESGKRLSDFPEFAAHVRRLIALRAACGDDLAIERYVDTVGIIASEAVATGYRGPDVLVLVVANVRDEPVTASVGVDASRHRVTTGTAGTRSSLGTVGETGVAGDGDQLRVTLPLEPFEVQVVRLKRHSERS